MRTLLLILGGAVLALGCGPRCESFTREAAFVNDCSADGDASAAQCQCAWDYLADRYSCEDFDSGNITLADVIDASNACS